MIEVTGIDHIYIAVSEMARSEAFYDRLLLQTLGFRKNRFALNGEPHVQYYNRLFGYAPGLHHFCLRVDSVAEVQAAARLLQAAGIAASEARHHPDYASDYWATFFEDPDGLRLEITNYRQERRQRHDDWEQLGEAG